MEGVKDFEGVKLRLVEGEKPGYCYGCVFDGEDCSDVLTEVGDCGGSMVFELVKDEPKITALDENAGVGMVLKSDYDLLLMKNSQL